MKFTALAEFAAAAAHGVTAAAVHYAQKDMTEFKRFGCVFFLDSFAIIYVEKKVLIPEKYDI